MADGAGAEAALAPAPAAAPAVPAATSTATVPAEGEGAAPAAPAAPAPAAPAGDEIKPYRIHVSSKYLDLTRQKLELTRLPHEVSEPKSKEWWEPKPQVEPLIDFWLEEYSWRDQEKIFNESIPQFRTSIQFPSSESPVRVHFVHAQSPHAGAVPLLLIPPFPATNLCLGHLVKQLTDPEDVERDQPFHLVIPSLPGLGFSDALPNNTPMVSATCEIFNSLMARLGYAHYLATNSGPAASSAAQIDWKLASHLSTRYAESCLGVHFIAPPLSSPRLQEAPWEWAKWSLASFFQAPILGYSDDDWDALDRMSASGGRHHASQRTSKKSLTPKQFGLNQNGLREPNTLAYALCDSPTGLLVFVLKSLRVLGPRKSFTPTEIINFTELAWLPGPEGAMRFWAHCASHVETAGEDADARRAATKPKVAITVFLGDEAPGADEEAGESYDILPHPATNLYACPGWGNARYDVVWASRAKGKPGLLAWERPEVIAEGARGLAKRLMERDSRLAGEQEPETSALEGVTVAGDSGEVPTRQSLAQEAQATRESEGEGEAEAGVSEGKSGEKKDKAVETRQGAAESPQAQAESSGAGQQTQPAASAPQPEAPGPARDQTDEPHTPAQDNDVEFDGESPDTIVAIPPRR